jgi:hypothetical protein
MAITSIPQMDSVWNLKFVEHQFIPLCARPFHLEASCLRLSGNSMRLLPWILEKIHPIPRRLAPQGLAIQAKMTKVTQESESDPWKTMGNVLRFSSQFG